MSQNIRKFVRTNYPENHYAADVAETTQFY